jgi:hypothetical protein
MPNRRQRLAVLSRSAPASSSGSISARVSLVWRPHRVVLDLGQQPEAETVADEQDDRRRMDAEDRDRRRVRCEQGDGQQGHQQRALGQAGDRGGGVLQVGAAIGEVCDCQKGGLGGEAAERVADRQPRIALGGGHHRGDGARQGGARAHEQGAGDDLAHPGLVGELVGDTGELGASIADGERRGDEHRGDRV